MIVRGLFLKFFGRRLISLLLPVLAPGILLLLLGCPSGGLGPGGLPGPLDGMTQGGALDKGGGGPSEDGKGGGGGGDDGDSGGDGNGGGGIYTYSPGLDGGIVSPIEDHPYKPSSLILGRAKSVCRAPGGKVKIQITGHVTYLAFSPLFQTEKYFDYSPERTLRILDQADGEFIDVKVVPFEMPTDANDLAKNFMSTRKNSFEVTFTTNYQELDLNFYLSEANYQSPHPENYGVEKSCPAILQYAAFSKALAVQSDGNASSLAPQDLCYDPSWIHIVPGPSIFVLTFNNDEWNPEAAPACSVIQQVNL